MKSKRNTLIRMGCGKHDPVQRVDIRQICQWIRQNEEDANRRVREMKAKEQKAFQQEKQQVALHKETPNKTSKTGKYKQV